MNLLTATLIPPNASDELGEAEPVLVDCDGLAVTFVLDSGERLVFLREELLAELAGAGERGVEAA